MVAAMIVAIVTTATASAATVLPNLTTVGATNFHLTATFQAPGAEDLTLSVATAPALSTSGAFLQENLVTAETITTSEIAAGSFLATQRIDPGHYWAYLNAVSFGCDDPPRTCASGHSNLVEFTVPEPKRDYRGLVKVYRNLGLVTLGLRISPAGDRQTRYKVCWMTARHARRCASGRVNGYSWFAPEDASVDVRLREMTRRTTFRWYIGGNLVAARTATTIPAM